MTAVHTTEGRFQDHEPNKGCEYLPSAGTGPGVRAAKWCCPNRPGEAGQRAQKEADVLTAEQAVTRSWSSQHRPSISPPVEGQ